MKKYSFLLLCLLITGCASMIPTILLKPAADNIKTVAFISVYTNSDIYDIKAPRTSVNIDILKSGANKTQTTEIESILNYAVKSYQDRLNGVGGWNWVPVSGVTSSEAYKKFAEEMAKPPSSGLLKSVSKAQDLEWIAAPGMARVPAAGAASSGKFISVAGTKDIRHVLAKLCKDLNVDAVAVLELDMAFNKLITGADLFGGIPAVPNIASSLVLVNKNGEVSVNSGLITKGQGRRFEGKSVNMLERDVVLLNDKSIAAYNATIDKSADDMKARLLKSFSAK